MQSRNATGNLINKYKAVLKKCALLNTFGSLAIATLMLAGPCPVMAKSISGAIDGEVNVEEVVTGGILRNVVTATYSGIEGDGYINAFDVNTKLGAVITLTGQHNNGGIIGTSNVYVGNMSTLIIGTATSPDKLSIGGDLTVTDGLQLGSGNPRYTTAIIEQKELTVGGSVNVEKSANLYINNGGALHASSLNLHYNGGGDGLSTTPSVYVGQYGSEPGTSGSGSLYVSGTVSLNDGQMYIGSGYVELGNVVGDGVRPALLVGSVRDENSYATLNITGSQGLHVKGTGGTFAVVAGEMNVEKILLETDARFSVGDSRFEHSVGTLNITGAEGLILKNEGYLNVEQGVANITKLDISKGSHSAGGFVRIGAESTQSTLNLLSGASYTMDIFDSPEFLDDGNHKSLYDKIAIGSAGVFNVQGTLDLSTANGNVLDMAGVLSAPTVNIDGGSGHALIQGGTLRITGDGNTSTADLNAGSITISAGTRHEYDSERNVLISDALNEGKLELAGLGESTLHSAVTVANAHASLHISSGSWTANNAIIVDSGSLVVNGGSFDVSGASLTMNSAAKGDLSNGTLTAKLSDFGSIDLSQASGAKFTDSAANVAINLFSNAQTSLVLSGYGSSVGITEAEYNALINELRTDIFGIGSSVGSIVVEGIGLDNSITALGADTHNPTGVIGSGDLLRAISVTYGGLVGGVTNINNAHATLTLTGMGSASSTLSSGNINIEAGTLVLGYNDGAGQMSPATGFVNGKLMASGAQSSVVVKEMEANVTGGMSFENAAALTVEGSGKVTTAALSLNAATATLNGEFVVTGNDGIDVKNGSTVTAQADVITTKLVVDNAQVIVDKNLTVQNELEVTNAAQVLIKGAGQSHTLSIDDSMVTVGDGSSAASLGIDSSLTLTGSGSLIVKDKGSVNLAGDYTLNLADTYVQVENGGTFATTANIYLDASTQQEFTHAGTLASSSVTVQNSQDMRMSSGILRVDGGTLEAGTITLQGGSIALATSSNGAHALQSNVTLENAQSVLSVDAGSWTTGDTIVVKNGSLTIASGAGLTVNTVGHLQVSGGSLQVGGSLHVEGKLDITSASTADISGGSLTASLESFGTVDLSQATGSQFSKVNGQGVEGLLTADATTEIILKGFGDSTIILSPGQYNALIAEMLVEITGGDLGSLSIEGIGFDPSLFTLSDIGVNILDQGHSFIKTGDLSKPVQAVFAGIEAFNGLESATISNSGATLTLTGSQLDSSGLATGHMGDIDITVTAGTLALGLVDKSPMETTLDGFVHATGADSTFKVQDIHATVRDGVTLALGAHMDIVQGATLSTPKLTVDNGQATIAGTMATTSSEGMVLLNGGAVDITGDATSAQVNIDGIGSQLSVAGVLTTDSAQGIHMSNGGTLSSSAAVNTAKITADSANLVLTDGLIQIMSSEEGSAGVYLSNASVLDVKGGVLNSAVLESENSTINITGSGVVRVNELITKNSDVNIAGQLQLIGDRTFTTHDFGTQKDVFNIQAGGMLSVVEGALTLDVSQNADFSTGGTVSAQDITLSGDNMNILSGTLQSVGGSISGADVTLKGGDIDLASGSGAQQLSSNVTVDSGSVRVSGGTWTADNTIKVQGGSLSVDGGSLSGSVDIQANGSLLVANGSLDVSGDNTINVSNGNTGSVAINKGGTLIADLADLGSVSGTSFTKGGTVDPMLTSASGGLLLLKNATGSVSFAEYETLSANAKNALFATGSEGSVSLDGITISDIENQSLDTISSANIGITQDTGIKGGTLAADNSNVSFSHVTTSVGGVKGSAILTLTGISNDGVLIDGDLAASDGGTLHLGSSAVPTAQNSIVTGDLRANAGTIFVENTKLTVQQDVIVESGSTITMRAGSALNVSGTALFSGTGNTLHVKNQAELTVNEMIMTKDSTMLVGDGDMAAPIGGTVVISLLDMNEGTVFLEPAWSNNASIDTASSGVFTNFAPLVSGGLSTVSGNLIVGQNSFVVTGDTSNAWAKSAFTDNGFTWGPSAITAGFFVNSALQIDVTAGAVVVDGSLKAPTTPTPGSMYFADNSLLMINVGNVGFGSTAISFTEDFVKDSTLTVGGTAKLHLDNERSGTHTIVGGVDIANGVWLKENISASNLLLSVDDAWFDDSTGEFHVTLMQNYIDWPFLDESMLAIVNNTEIDENSDNMGIRFISRTFDDSPIDGKNAVRDGATLEGAAQMAAVGAVGMSTMNASRALTSTILHRTSLAYPVADRMVAHGAEGEKGVNSGDEMGRANYTGLGVWAMPLYQSSSASGFKANSYTTGYTSDLTGLSLGADITFDDIFRLGAAFSVGAGNTTSSGDFNETTNDFDFWGLSLYGGLQHNNFGLILDLGYTSSSNELTQKVPSRMYMQDLRGDVTSSAWTMGLTAEYLWKTKYLDIIPHAGVRYTVLNTAPYKAESGNSGTVFSSLSSNQGIFTAPIGVTLSKNFTTQSGWTLSPRVDVGIIVAAGDLEARTQASVPGVVGTTNMLVSNMDALSFDGGLGLELKKGDFSLGVNYNTQISEHKTDQMLFGFVRYEFGGEEENPYTNRGEKGLNSGSLLQSPILVGDTEDATDSAAQNPDAAQQSSDSQGQGSENASNASNAENAEQKPELTLLSGASAPAEGADGDVHLLAPVEIKGILIGSGSYSIGGNVLRSLPNSSGSITGALKGMSNVQFSNAEQSSQQGGEIAPPRISIYGSKSYENNFLVDGMSVSNVFNPSGFEGSSSGNHVGSPNDLIPGGGDQDIFYDSHLIEKIDVYTNNVPAKYGNFSGGAVDATLRDPKTDQWHFRASMRGTSSSWYEVRSVDTNSTTAASQPEFDIYSFSGTAEGPITDSLSALFGYTNRHSIIPLSFEDFHGNVSTKNQYRINQNFFGKFVLKATDDFTLGLDASYAPYEDLRWREYWPGSEQKLFNDALRVALSGEYETDLGTFEAKIAYLKSGFSTEAASSHIEQDRNAGIETGGFGDRLVNQNEFSTTLDYISPLKTTGWLNWKIEAGLDVNITSIDLWAEETTADILVNALEFADGRTYSRRTETLYPETTQYNTMTAVGFYAQAELNYERITFTPGIRIDTDSLTNNVDIAPRLKLELDVFNNNMLRLVAGYNRYYGKALREYAFSRYRQFSNTQTDVISDPANPHLPPEVKVNHYLGASRNYDITGLQTPYSDEYTFGMLGTIWNFDYTLDYTYREHKNQLVSKEDGEQSVFHLGKWHTQSIYKLTNEGRSNYEGITLTLGRTFDLNKWGNHFISLGMTMSRTKTFDGSYNDETSFNESYGYQYNHNQVYYNGQLVNRSDLPADDYNSPLTLTLNIHSSFFDDRLRINWLNRWRGDSDGLMRDSRTSDEAKMAGAQGTTSGSNYEESSEWVTSDGDYVQAFKEGTIKGGLISDINVEYDVWKEEDFTFGVSLDVYNIFNTEMGVAASDPDDVSEGTSFWIGVYAEF